MAAEAPVTTAEVQAAHERLARYIYGHFRRKLTFEDARDAAAEALGEADRAVEGGATIENLDRWLKRAAWRNALDAIRRAEGEGDRPRPRVRPLELDDVGATAADAEHETLLEEDARAADARAIATAWASLKPDEQRVLHLRYFDETPVDQVLELLGCSRHHLGGLSAAEIVGAVAGPAVQVQEDDDAIRPGVQVA